jgi:quercetin dioxygenase-like cupin family protein
MEGILARTVRGAGVTLAVIDLDPGLRMPEHRHPQEQLGVVVRGELSLTVAGDTRRRRPGDLWVIPADVPHSVEVGAEGCRVVESFVPARADWETVPRLDPRPAAWPSR